jgi:hypothetical protein
VSVYRVSGILKFRDHLPGQIFIATLPQGQEERALANGWIEILQRGPVTIEEHRIRPPKG